MTNLERTRTFDYMYFGTINIGTLKDKAEEIVHTMTERNLKLIGLAETRFSGNGHRNLHEDFELFYSGDQASTRHGVAIILHPDICKYVEKVIYVNNRIIALTLNLQSYKVSFIQAYAPQQGRPQEEKEAFYNDLQDTFDSLPTESEINIIGDLNGHVGCDRVENVIGDFGVGERNEEGETLIDFCVRNSLSIMNTFFKHQESHQYTWYRYNSQLGCYDLKTQIDFVLTTRKSTIKDVKAIPSESLDSDHRLVKAKMKIHLPKKEKSMVRKRVKIENIKEAEQEIQQSLRENAESIKSEDVEEYWKNLRDHIQDIQENIIGMKNVGKTKKKKTGWWTEEVKAEVEKKKLLFRKWLKERTPESRETYVNQRKTVYYAKKKAKTDMWSKIGEDLEADLKGTRKLIYSMSKNYKNRSDDKPKNATIKDKDGEMITGQENVAARWVEYFEDLLNVENEEMENEDDHEDNDESDQLINNLNHPITMEELEKAIRLTKSNKAAGPDLIPIETLKAGGQPLKNLLLDLMNLAWNTGTVPEEWNQSIICPIFKNKGDPLDCANHRGISLMSHAGKLYERVLEMRLRAEVEELLSESQCGFRPGRGTIDQIAALRLFLDKSWEHDINQYICFLDLEKAFDRVPREKIWKVLFSSGIDNQLLKAIKSTYLNQRSTVIGGTIYFTVNTGVRQGSVLSPLLFIVYMNTVILKIEQENFKLEKLGYADDVGQTADSMQKLQEVMNTWDRELTAAGLKLNYKKTEVMKVGRCPEEGDIVLNGNTLKETENFTYLGSCLSASNLIEDEINNRIAKFSKNLNCLYPLLKEKSIPKDVKVCIYKTILRPVLLYACETWTLTKRLQSKIQAAEMRILRLIYGVTRRDRKRNDDIRAALKVNSILSIIEKSQLRWFGHIIRMDENRDVKRILEWKPTEKRPRGRPRKRWIDQIREITSRKIGDFEKVKRLARDRDKWRKFIWRLVPDGQ